MEVIEIIAADGRCCREETPAEKGATFRSDCRIVLPHAIRYAMGYPSSRHVAGVYYLTQRAGLVVVSYVTTERQVRARNVLRAAAFSVPSGARGTSGAASHRNIQFAAKSTNARSCSTRAA